MDGVFFEVSARSARRLRSRYHEFDRGVIIENLAARFAR
jgi:hypothetical protein